MASVRSESTIPVIPLEDGSAECAKELVDAARQWGFLYISAGSDISQSKIDRMFELSKKFFSSPREDKEKCAISANNRGWSSMHSETLNPQNQRRGDFKEALNFGEFSNGKAQQPLPPSLVPHEVELAKFADQCHELCLRLLRLFALGLKIDKEDGGEEWFASRHDQANGPSGSILRLLYYPAIPPGADYIPEVDIRAGAHSDYGSVTLLFQRPSQDGLEILLPNGGGWTAAPVNPPGYEGPPPILVNLGDLLSYWTAGLLRSTIHRVIFPPHARRGGEDRYSMVYFCHPVDTTPLVPVPSKIVQERGNRGANETEGTVITAAQHLKSKLAASYEWGK
ncbi:Clavaminate synthase-like protein [Terfezia boudieri ATCC MYA-4762]|uniref:Clavaminate synthase-like protein n=1 Tax=Terfezia boudieri ATCC MYA-4762 TaxID=1051890 RepID=A0A3N4M3T8_9PEZI|nr:Clavaminate synthase-like protein [Terfezia boudieri ATCC MYA-4762]